MCCLNYIRLGQNIRSHRLARGLTQTELAQRAGCSRSTLSALENGKRCLSTELLFRIAGALQTRASELTIGV